MRQAHRLHAMLFGLLTIAGCGGTAATTPLADGSDGKTFDVGVSAAISDGFRPDGTAGFYWLPPIAPRHLTYGAPFEPSFKPVVDVCEWSAGACGTIVATMTTDGTADGRITVNTGLEAYETTWRPKAANLDTKATYRIRVSLGSRVLGYADVDVIRSLWGLLGVDVKNFVPLIAGLDLPIRFRLDRRTTPPTVLTFDDSVLTPAQINNAIRVNFSYGGLTWAPGSIWSVGTFSPLATCHSLPNCASPNGNQGDLGFGGFGFTSPAIFQGLWLGGLNPGGPFGDPNVSVYYQLSLAGQVVFTSPSYKVVNGSWFFAPSGYAGLVDEVSVLSSGDTDEFLIDDITYVQIPTSSAAATVSLGRSTK